MCVQLIILALLNLCVNSKKHCDALEIENISRIIIGIAEVQCVLCGLMYFPIGNNERIQK